MVTTKRIIIGAFLICLSVIFQLTPVLFSEIFVFLTVLSGFPMYVISKISPKVGVMAYAISALVILCLSVHESIFFLCTNGIVGLSLGATSYYTNKKLPIVVIASITLTFTLSIINFIIGVPVFGVKIPFSIFIQLGIFFAFAIIYNSIYLRISKFLFKIINKHYKE
ncbi:hypothetical protein [uncultured Clostridium sp.]|uniref:hypothetical protein n=1 Tax=uncultured Clostridium sp. TaxID=59620 RepID=UPI0028F1235B|nr:hypothetical protein [uncultured Clostridium sp.]